MHRTLKERFEFTTHQIPINNDFLQKTVRVRSTRG